MRRFLYIIITANLILLNSCVSFKSEVAINTAKILTEKTLSKIFKRDVKFNTQEKTKHSFESSITKEESIKIFGKRISKWLTYNGHVEISKDDLLIKLEWVKVSEEKRNLILLIEPK